MSYNNNTTNTTTNNHNYCFYTNPQEEDLFPLTFTQQTPILSYGSSPSIDNSPISSYQDNLLLNHSNIDSYLNLQNNTKNVLTNKNNKNNNSNDNNNINEDLVFELENDFISSIKQQTSSTTTTSNKIFTDASKNMPDSFADGAQQNYRLWLSTF